MMNRLKILSRLRMMFFFAAIIPVLMLGFIAYYNMYKVEFNHHNENILYYQTQNLRILEDRTSELLFINNIRNDILLINLSEAKIKELLKTYISNDNKSLGVMYINLKSGKTVSISKVSINLESILLNIGKNSEIYFENNYVYLISKNEFSAFVSVISKDQLFLNTIVENLSGIIYYEDKNIYANDDIIDYPSTSSNLKDYEKDYSIGWLNGEKYNYKIALISKHKTISDYFNDEILDTMVLLLFSILIIILIIVIYSRKIIKIFIEIYNAINQLLEGNYLIRLKEKGNREIVEIIKAFNKMAEFIGEKIMKEEISIEQVIKKNKEINDDTNKIKKMNIEAETIYKELQIIERKNEVIINKSNRMILRYNIDGIITFMNRRAMNELGIENYSNTKMHDFSFRFKDLQLTSEVIDFLTKNETDLIEIEFLNKKTNIFKTVIIKNRKIVQIDGTIVFQIVGKDPTLEYILEENLNKKNSEYEILDGINFGLYESSDIDKYYNIIMEKLFETIEPLEVSVRKVKNGYINTYQAISTINEHCKTNSIKIKGSIFEKVIISKEIVIIRKNQLLQMELNKYYKMERIIGVIDTVYLIPIVIDKAVREIVVVIGSKKRTQKEVELMLSIVNHLNLASQRFNLINSLKKSGIQTIKALTSVIEAKDRYTVGHSSRVAELSRYIAQKMEFDKKDVEEIYLAGLLHDIGKLGVDDRILTKEGKLTDEEYDKIKEHPEIGYRILKHADYSKNILDGILFHHKRYDLKGYPDIIIDELSIIASIIGIADALDAIVTYRSYSSGKDLEYAINELKINSGLQFNPIVVDIVVTEINNNRKWFEKVFINGGDYELFSTIS